MDLWKNICKNVIIINIKMLKKKVNFSNRAFKTFIGWIQPWNTMTDFNVWIRQIYKH